MALIISSFFLLPVSTFLLAQYLQSTSQILVMVIGLLISYKIFTRTESDIEIFMRAFQKRQENTKKMDKFETYLKKELFKEPPENKHGRIHDNLVLAYKLHLKRENWLHQ